MTDKTREKEVWKTYPEFPFIEANQFGEIRTVDRVVTRKNGRKLFVRGRVLKQWPNQDGYMRIQFRVNGKLVFRFVHRIIATCFLPNPKNLPEVDHIDCDTSNNAVSNLRWCTHQENVTYRDKLGHTAKYNAPKKPVIAVNLGTLEVMQFESQAETSRQLNISRGNIWSVIKGQRNKAGDYWFCYADEKAIEKVRKRFGDEIVIKVEKLMV